MCLPDSYGSDRRERYTRLNEVKAWSPSSGPNERWLGGQGLLVNQSEITEGRFGHCRPFALHTDGARFRACYPQAATATHSMSRHACPEAVKGHGLAVSAGSICSLISAPKPRGHAHISRTRPESNKPGGQNIGEGN